MHIHIIINIHIFVRMCIHVCVLPDLDCFEVSSGCLGMYGVSRLG